MLFTHVSQLLEVILGWIFIIKPNFQVRKRNSVRERPPMTVLFPMHQLIKSTLNYSQQLLRAQKRWERQGGMLGERFKYTL